MLFLLREERGTKKRKRDRLGPFSNPHEVPMQEAVRNHRACKSPCGEFVRGGSVSLLWRSGIVDFLLNFGTYRQKSDFSLPLMQECAIIS